MHFVVSEQGSCDLYVIIGIFYHIMSHCLKCYTSVLYTIFIVILNESRQDIVRISLENALHWKQERSLDLMGAYVLLCNPHCLVHVRS